MPWDKTAPEASPRQPAKEHTLERSAYAGSGGFGKEVAEAGRHRVGHLKPCVTFQRGEPEQLRPYRLRRFLPRSGDAQHIARPVIRIDPKRCIPEVGDQGEPDWRKLVRPQSLTRQLAHLPDLGAPSLGLELARRTSQCLGLILPRNYQR